MSRLAVLTFVLGGLWLLFFPGTALAFSGSFGNWNVQGDCYTPGQEPTICFNITYDEGSAPNQGIKKVEFTFPLGWDLSLESQHDALDAYDINDNSVAFWVGEGDPILPGPPSPQWWVCLDVVVPEGTSGPQTVLWSANGTDGATIGDEPINLDQCQSPPPSKPVPSLSEWGIILMSMIFAVAAIVFIRREKPMS